MCVFLQWGGRGREWGGGEYGKERGKYEEEELINVGR